MDSNEQVTLLETWRGYAESKASQEPGMALVLAFVSRFPDLFAKEGTTPRDWSHAADALSVAMASKESTAREDFQAALPALMPAGVARLLSEYLEREREPREIAEALVGGAPFEGVLRERFEKSYDGGFSAGAHDIGYYFGVSLATAAVQVIGAPGVNAEATETATRGFVRGTAPLNDDVAAFAVSHFAAILKKSLPHSVYAAVAETIKNEFVVQKSSRGYILEHVFGADDLKDPSVATTRRRNSV